MSKTVRIPGFNQDDEQNSPAKVAEFKRLIREADAILFVTPEYNYAIPGVLKNGIDLLYASGTIRQGSSATCPCCAGAARRSSGT